MKEFQLDMTDEIERMKVGLREIAAFKGECLIAPSLGPEADRAHQIGSNKAFEQAAQIASEALDGVARPAVIGLVDRSYAWLARQWVSRAHDAHLAADLEIIARRIDFLHAALTRYGRHSLDCQRPRGPECDCGWDELQAKLAPANSSH